MDGFNMDVDNLKLKTDVNIDDFSSFMNKVDQVESIIRGLKSDDKLKQQISMEKADYLLGNGNKSNEDIDEDQLIEKSNRTVINKEAFLKEDNPDEMSKEAFMRSVEQDAKRRAEERRQMKETADRHKGIGVKAFRAEQYEKALVNFSKAINCIRDSCVLYTNRSLTYLKLGLPNEALKDAETALKLNEKSVKAIIYKAQSLHSLGQEKNSRKVIDEACKELPEHEQFFRETQESWQ